MAGMAGRLMSIVIAVTVITAAISTTNPAEPDACWPGTGNA
jgi:hypothetical protein